MTKAMAGTLLRSIAVLAACSGCEHKPYAGNQAVDEAARVAEQEMETREREHRAVADPTQENAPTPREAEEFIGVLTRGDSKAIRAALEADPRLANAKTEKGITPLFVAVSNGIVPMAELLVEAGADVNQETVAGYLPLHIAARGRNDMVEKLIGWGAEVNAKDYKGLTPLHEAAAYNSARSIKELLEAGAQINARADDGMTPLHVAGRAGSTEAVELLIAEGAKMNATDGAGRTPVHAAAVATETPKALRRMLRAKADPSPRDQNGATPAHYAAAAGHVQNVSYLQSFGADINARDDKGQTPLHWAAMHGNMANVRDLGALGADLDVKDQNGRTPADLARGSGHREVAEFLDEVITGNN